MTADSTLHLCPHPPPQHSRPLSMAIPSPHAPSSAARVSAPTTTRARPQREAATKARKRVEDAYALYPFEQDTDSDSDVSSTRPSAPRPTPVTSDDSSDSDAFVDDSESDCSRPSEAAPGKRRKRSASPVMDKGEKKKLRAGGLLDMDARKPEEGTMGFMATSGDAVKNVLPGKASRASRASLSEPAEGFHGENRGRYVRRAGLSDMGPETGCYIPSWRDEVCAKAAGEFVHESRKSVGKGPVDGNGYRISRFSEHL